VKEEDLIYLKCIEHEPFTPIGWLYTSVYDGLTERGLAVRTGGSYFLSPLGRQELARLRHERNDD